MAGKLNAGNAAADSAAGATEAADEDGLIAFWIREYATADVAAPATAVTPPIAPLAIGTPIASPTFCAAWSWAV
jgi:hypothetical protein